MDTSCQLIKTTVEILLRIHPLQDFLQFLAAEYFSALKYTVQFLVVGVGDVEKYSDNHSISRESFATWTLTYQCDDCVFIHYYLASYKENGMDDHIKQALEIVKAQAGFRTMTEEEISSMVRSLSTAIRQIMSGDYSQPASGIDASARQISEKSVTCLECGKSFKLLTRRHLLSHNLNADEYREKWGYPKDVPLVCKSLQRERRKKMKDMKLWEKRRKESQ